MSTPQLAPVDRSPLRVRRKKMVLTVTVKGGDAVVVDGSYGAYGSPEPFIARTAGGVWRIQTRGADRGSAVLDATGRQVATLTRERFRPTVLHLPGGEQISLARIKVPFVNGCAIGDLGRVKAPFLFPQRGYTLTLTADGLARPDRELIVAVGAYIAESVISSQLSDSSS